MRIAIAIIGLLALIAGLAAVKGVQIGKLMAFVKHAEQQGPPPEAVSAATADLQRWEGTLYAVGSVAADKGVGVTTESSGIVTRLLFDSGETVEKGKLLVELDTNVERAQLDAARARSALAGVNLTRTRALFASASVPKSQLDADQAAQDSAAAEASALAAAIARKHIRAPFTGRLGIRAVNLGQYLAPGAQITVLEAIELVYVDFTLPQERLQSLETGLPVRVKLAAGDPIEGTISAIDPSVDSTTRTIKLRAAVPNRKEHLRSGMFVSVSVILPGDIEVVAIPGPAVVHAPYGDSVFVVEDAKDANGAPGKMVRQQFVRLGESRGDFVAVLDGVKPGQELVTSGAFKMHNGARIMITKDVKPAPELAPHPQNR